MTDKLKQLARDRSRWWHLANIALVGAIMLGVEYIRADKMDMDELLAWFAFLGGLSGAEWWRAGMENGA